MYAGHETVIKPSEYIHLVIYLLTYALLVISVIYAYLAITKIYDVRIHQRNGADGFIWAGLLMSLFAFIGLTATGTGRLGMNIVRTNTEKRVSSVESKINEHLPAIRSHVETHLQPIRSKVEATKAQIDSHLEPTRSQVESHLPEIKSKVNDLHESTFGGSSMMSPLVGKNSKKGLTLPKSQFQGSQCI